MNSYNASWSKTHTTFLFLIVISMVLISFKFGPDYREFTWFVIMLLFFLFTLIAGHGITGVWKGLFIDERNEISLSRLQMILWTIIILSSYLTIALTNIAVGWQNPLAIAIPNELWIAMGISTTSMVGSPLLLSQKKQKKFETIDLALMANKLYDQGEDPNDFDAVGGILVRNNPQNAKWANLFRGEELTNAAHLDLAKIQMFFFTIVILIAYAASISSLLAPDDIRIDALPALDQSVVILLSISHGGYLVNKTLPQK